MLQSCMHFYTAVKNCFLGANLCACEISWLARQVIFDLFLEYVSAFCSLISNHSRQIYFTIIICTVIWSVQLPHGKYNSAPVKISEISQLSISNDALDILPLSSTGTNFT
jgi:hypothetical protein